MKKLISCWLLGIYPFSFSEIREVFELPILIEHLISHKVVNFEMSFSHFTDLHYFSKHEEDSNYSQDIQLSFKSTEVNHALSSLSILPILFSLKVGQIFAFLKEENNFSYFKSITTESTHLIFSSSCSVD